MDPDPDRFVGCLLGGALGDSLGYPVEFSRTKDEIVTRFGTAPPERLSYAGESVVSDDTQMTLFSAEAAIRARARDAAEIASFALGAYQRWFATQQMSPGGPPRTVRDQGLLLREPRLFARRAPGNTCLAAVALSFTRPDLPSVADPPNGSKGCGAVMRAAPFGLAASSRADAFRIARDTSVLTHGDPSGYLAAAYLAALVFDLARGEPFATALDAADALLAAEPEHEEVAALLARARGAENDATIESIGEGWVAEEALAIGVLCARDVRADTVCEALWRAAAHGGDSDSTASIAGNLIGAALGARALPAAWLAELELAGLVERVARDLHAAAIEGRALDTADYPQSDGRFQLPRA